MQSVMLLAIGKIKTPWIAEGCHQYMHRIRPHLKLDVKEVAASKQWDSKKHAEEESQHLVRLIERRGKADVWILDERGEAMTSNEFSKLLSRSIDRGEHLVFVLGGSHGMTEAVRKVAKGAISFSAMTFPHELCRVVFLEQLYRACEIVKGTGYHH